MTKTRLDKKLVSSKIVSTRSQAESYIKLGKVQVNGEVITKAGYFVNEFDKISLAQSEQYVSRAGLKLASIAEDLKLDFKHKTVLDVGSSTGGFTDFALRRGARKVIAVDVGTEQLHPSLRGDNRVELYEQTDVRSLALVSANVLKKEAGRVYIEQPDIVLIDVNFISLREILPSVAKLCSKNSLIVAMVKPQFEAVREQINKGIIKNDSYRRQIFKEFEIWSNELFVIKGKADSQVAGAKGNVERFYFLKVIN